MPGAPRGRGPRPREMDSQGSTAMGCLGSHPHCEPAVLVQGLEAKMGEEGAAFMLSLKEKEGSWHENP